MESRMGMLLFAAAAMAVNNDDRHRGTYLGVDQEMEAKVMGRRFRMRWHEGEFKVLLFCAVVAVDGFLEDVATHYCYDWWWK